MAQVGQGLVDILEALPAWQQAQQHAQQEQPLGLPVWQQAQQGEGLLRGDKGGPGRREINGSVPVVTDPALLDQAPPSWGACPRGGGCGDESYRPSVSAGQSCFNSSHPAIHHH